MGRRSDELTVVSIGEELVVNEDRADDGDEGQRERSDCELSPVERDDENKGGKRSASSSKGHKTEPKNAHNLHVSPVHTVSNWISEGREVKDLR